MSASVRIAGLGLAVTPPPGWEATIYRRPSLAGEATYPVLHAATVPLVAGRGDYGSGVVETLGALDVFVGLLDFGSAAAGSPLFAATGLPGLSPDVFRPKALQRVIAGQAGVQRFFTAGNRAMCLYVVLGAFANRGPLTYRANHVIGSLGIDARP